MTRLHATAEHRQALRLNGLNGLARANGSVAAMVPGLMSEVSEALEVRTLAASKLESGLGYWDTSG